MRFIKIIPVQDRVQSWIVFGILSVFLLVAFVWQPSDNGMTLCYFRNITGLPCPGCGITRSLCAMAKGNIFRSFEYHIFGPLVFLIAIGFWIRSIFELIYRKTVIILLPERIKRKLIPAFIICLCLFWIARIGYTLSHQTPDSEFKHSLISHFFTHHR
ncbi:MAG: DUF2752 domain-containing protein [bacterium]